MIAATSVVVIPIIPGMVQALLGAASGFDAGGVTGEGGVLVGTSGLVGGDVGDPGGGLGAFVGGDVGFVTVGVPVVGFGVGPLGIMLGIDVGASSMHVALPSSSSFVLQHS